MIAESKEEAEKPVESPITEEKKSIFASICGCMGGSPPPADVDPKEPEEKTSEESEKEEVKPEEEDKAQEG